MTMVHLLKRHKGYQCVLQSEEDWGSLSSFNLQALWTALSITKSREAVGTG